MAAVVYVVLVFLLISKHSEVAMFHRHELRHHWPIKSPRNISLRAGGLRPSSTLLNTMLMLAAAVAAMDGRMICGIGMIERIDKIMLLPS
jgi:hypothetical protein